MLNQAPMVKLLAVLYWPVLLFPCPYMGANFLRVLSSASDIELAITAGAIETPCP